jgi:hypothetical protein
MRPTTPRKSASWRIACVRPLSVSATVRGAHARALQPGSEGCHPPLAARPLGELHHRLVLGAAPEAEQLRLGDEARGDEDARADDRGETGIAGHRAQGARDLEAAVAQRDRVADAGVERDQEGGVHQGARPGRERAPPSRRLGDHVAVERVVAGDRAHLHQPGVARPGGHAHRRERGLARDGHPGPPERVEERVDPAVNGARAPNATSPPRSARDCPRTERVTFPANESIATSAATPSEIDDM